MLIYSKKCPVDYLSGLNLIREIKNKGNYNQIQFNIKKPPHMI